MKGHTAAATLEAGRRPGPSKWMQTRARRASTTRTREDSMGAKSEALATQFEAKAKDAAAVLGKLTDADWKKGTAGEKWTVAATAHHLARSYEALASVIPMLASGGSLGGLTRAAADQQNDAQAK